MKHNNNNFNYVQIDAILARCFDVYSECTSKEIIETSKQEYISELVDTPIQDDVWQELKHCKLIQVRESKSRIENH